MTLFQNNQANKYRASVQQYDAELEKSPRKMYQKLGNFH